MKEISNKSIKDTPKNKSEKVTYTKRTDNEEVTKTVEKISNGYLLTVDCWDYNDGSKNKCTKKYFETDPLKDNDSDKKSEFQEGFEILEM